MNVTIIVDASHCPDTRAAGYGYWIAAERGKQGGGGSMRELVNNSGAAEMLAVCNALFIALEHKLVEAGDRVLVQTDCQSAIGAFRGERMITDPQEKKAVDYLRSLQSEHSLAVYFRHVKGHTNRPEARFITNRLCDQRARDGMKRARIRIREGSPPSLELDFTSTQSGNCNGV